MYRSSDVLRAVLESSSKGLSIIPEAEHTDNRSEIILECYNRYVILSF
jgi:hypothetical protein